MMLIAGVPTVVVTGATSGLGQIVSIELAKRGAHLVLTTRDEARANATRAAIEAVAPGTQVDFHFVDFARLDEVRSAAHAIAARYDRIDVLINNAGIHAFKQRITGDGYAEMIAVNYLAPWLFTNILRDKLIASAPSRVVTVASEASRHGTPFHAATDLFKTQPFSRIGSSRIYGQTKLMDIMFSLELARQLMGTGVVANCLDPGFNVTGLGRELSFAAPLERLLRWLNIGDPRRGAGIILTLATDPAFAMVSGGYYSFDQAKRLSPIAPADDPEVRMRLWSITAEKMADQLSSQMLCREESRYRPVSY